MAFTYSLTSNPGNLFNILGTSLRVNNSSIAAGNYPITVRADDGLGNIIFQNMVIVATPVGSAPSLKFNLIQNSQYVGTMIGSV